MRSNPLNDCANEEVNDVGESAQPLKASMREANGCASKATSKENSRPALSGGEGPARKRKTSICSQSSTQSGAATAQAKRPALTGILETDQTWEELSEEKGLDVPMLLTSKMPTRLRMDIRGQRDWFREQHSFMRVYVKHIQGMEDTLGAEQDQLESVMAEQVQKREAELAQMHKLQEAQEQEMIHMKSMCADIESSLQEATKREAELTRDFTEATEAITACQAQVAKREQEKARAEGDAAAAQAKLQSLTEEYSKTQHYNNSLQEYNNRLQKDLSSNSFAMEKLQNDKSSLQEETGLLKGQNSALQVQLDAAKASAEEAEKAKLIAQEETAALRADLLRVTAERNTLDANLKTAQGRLAELEGSMAEKVKQADALTAELTTLKANYDVLQQTSASQAEVQAERVEELRREAELAKERADMAELSSGEAGLQFRNLNARIAQLETELSESERRARTGEQIRRRLHNTLLELKGNIRVFCRVRPFMPDEAPTDEGAAVNFPQDDTDKIDLTLASASAKAEEGKTLTHSFTFDRVFRSDTSQQDVFDEITQLVQSALDGYKVCIFAYGQTGSGKTHTMLGTGEQVGMIPLSLQQIFASAQELATRGWDFKIQASMFEIYNEEIKDLLGNGKAATHKIQHDAKGNTVVTELKVLDVSDAEQAAALMEQASQARSVGRTNANDRSSRSHCLFVLHLHGFNKESGQTTHGILNLIDLAGSERLSKSGATGERLKETQAINKSLSCLGDVVFSLANKEAHVPFRNSKLTYLLQPCLGGDAKTLMFVNVAPTKESAHESLCSLRFAAKVNSCDLGVAKKNSGLKRTEST